MQKFDVTVRVRTEYVVITASFRVEATSVHGAKATARDKLESYVMSDVIESAEKLEIDATLNNTVKWVKS